MELVSSARDVLVIGNVPPEFLGSLGAQGCAVTYLRVGDPGVEEPLGLSSPVEVLPLSADTLPPSLGSSTFDAVLIDGDFDRFHQPRRLLIELRRVLREGGFVTAPITNSGHGAIRLAVLADAPAKWKLAVPAYFRGLTKEGMNELFVQAGFNLEAVEHVSEPIFGAGGGLPKLERRDFPRALVAAIEAGSHSEIYQFVVKAVPSSMTGDVAGLETGKTRDAGGIAENEGDEDTTVATILQLGRELDAHQATRKELLSTLEVARASAAGFEKRLRAMTARRIRLETERNRIAAFQKSLVQESQARVAEYEKAWSALYVELEDLRARAVELKREAERRDSELEEAQTLLAAERKLTAESEDARLKLAAQLNGLRDELIEERDRRQQLEEHVESARRQSEMKASSADEAERRAQTLQADVDRGSEYVAELLAELAAKERQISENIEHASRLEHEWTEFHEQLAVQTLSAQEAHQRAASLQVQVDRGANYVADLLAQLAEKEQQLSKAAEQVAEERQRTAVIEDARSKLAAQLTGLQRELEAEQDRRQRVEAQTSRAEEEARQRVNSLQFQVDRGAEYVADLLEQLAGKEKQISALASEQQAAQAKVGELAGSVSALEDEIKTLRNAISVQPSAGAKPSAAETPKQAKSSESGVAPTSRRLKGEIDKLKRAREKLGDTLRTGRSR